MLNCTNIIDLFDEPEDLLGMHNFCSYLCWMRVFYIVSLVKVNHYMSTFNSIFQWYANSVSLSATIYLAALVLFFFDTAD